MVRINLIPASILARQQRRSHLQRWLVPIACAFTGVLVLLWLTFCQRAKASDIQVKTTQILRQVTASQQQLIGARAKSTQLREKMGRADALRRKRAWTQIIAIVTQSLPTSAWLTSISTDPTVPSKFRRSTSATVPTNKTKKDAVVATIDAARKLRLLGYTSHSGEPYDLVRRLKSSGVFESVTLTYARRQDVLEGSYFRFEVVCEW